ncbi:YdcF family protein [Komarekiella sp. 'clone 1']|uniref:YdcF family protein n=1 Tax=Komarekiella delphini-convector SJRDD-AB1 TaxID=2593771 RepID=A0AA40T333_9NOST|nr:ElyC/SanA/YdcF family protein [Komarekiella delphini-convector]MBD6620001.1 YdcF family protein [Komarekiella delphini-convector SJRDD-AB1]
MQKRYRQSLKLPKFHLLKRQQIWTLTAQGWLIFLVITAYLTFLTITHIHPFLAVNSPIKTADALVVEGWVPDYGIQQALTEFNNGSYHLIITTGSSIERGSYLIGYKNFAEVSAATFKKLGLASEKVIAVPTPSVIKDRSYASAAEFRRWLSNSDVKIESINLLSWDVHSRRSWLLFKQILAPKIQVGVIAAKNNNYDPSKWWVSSEGVRTIMSETIAYIYARFLNWKA